jgi:hypothetical protein
VLTLGEQDVWQCPRCRRGSPDIRDEAAHLDAHRRLERDLTLVTWEVLVHRLTRPGPESGDGRRRRTPLLLAVVAAMLLLSLLLSVDAGEVLPGQATETPAPTPTTAAPVPSAPTIAVRSSVDEARAERPPPSVPPVTVETGPSASSPPAISTPPPAAAAPPTTTPAEPVDQPHLLELCLSSLCLAV